MERYRIKACDLRVGMVVLDPRTGRPHEIIAMHEDPCPFGDWDNDRLHLELANDFLSPHPKDRMIVLSDGIPAGFE